MDTTTSGSGIRQFSLRKLLLWVAVVAVYFAFVPLIAFPLTFFAALTIWLAVLLLARLCWGVRGGIIAVPVIAVVMRLLMSVTVRSASFPFFYHWVASFACTIPAGLLGLVFVDAVVRLVNWLDGIGRGTG
jgi:hypothetical protein